MTTTILGFLSVAVVAVPMRTLDAHPKPVSEAVERRFLSSDRRTVGALSSLILFAGVPFAVFGLARVVALFPDTSVYL
jgi:hypothetical protein